MKYYHKWDARYMTDTNENTLVFGMWDTESPDVEPAPDPEPTPETDGARSTKTVKK